MNGYTVFAATGVNVVHGGSRACYVPSTDNVHTPCIDFFRDAESYYATLAHEATHWTLHPSRLDRAFGRERFGDEGYAMAELVDELGSAFLCADLELTPEVREDHLCSRKCLWGLGVCCEESFILRDHCNLFQCSCAFAVVNRRWPQQRYGHVKFKQRSELRTSIKNFIEQLDALLQSAPNSPSLSNSFAAEQNIPDHRL